MPRFKCDDCGANHGLAEYTDGTYCFACNKQTPINKIVSYKKISQVITPELINELPKQALDFLKAYYITDEILNNRLISWEQSTNRIAFSVGDDRYWLRTINPNIKPKWLYVGDKTNKSFWYVSENSDSKELCLVEDVISAVRVAEHIDCVALGGTIASAIEVHKLILDYDIVNVWLDGDAAGQRGAEKIKKDYGLYKKIRIIKTKKDPKCYSPQQIKEVLND